MPAELDDGELVINGTGNLHDYCRVTVTQDLSTIVVKQATRNSDGGAYVAEPTQTFAAKDVKRIIYNALGGNNFFGCFTRLLPNVDVIYMGGDGRNDYVGVKNVTMLP